jgi:hypothetical protein
MNSGNLLTEINLLPIVVKEKIISFYILNYLRANIPAEIVNSLYSSSGFEQYNLICLYFDKFNKYGYINITSRDLHWIYRKFGYISCNNFCNATCKDLIEVCWKSLQFYYNELKILPGKPLKYNLIIAGGFFTNYIATSIFNNEFKSYFEYFNKNKDIDLYYYNSKDGKNSKYDNYYIQVKNYAKINLVSVNNPNTVSAVNQFDFNCCTFLIKFI